MPVSLPHNPAATREPLSVSGPGETDRPRPAGLSGALSHVVNTATPLYAATQADSPAATAPGSAYPAGENAAPPGRDKCTPYFAGGEISCDRLSTPHNLGRNVSVDRYENINSSGMPFFSHAFAPAERPESPDVWFDARTGVDLDEEWFDAAETLSDTRPGYDTPEVSVTEDCRRTLIQLVRSLGEIAQYEMMTVVLSKLLPDVPYGLITTACNVYSALREGRNIDHAALGVLGLASSIPGPGNVIAELAQYIRQTVAEQTGGLIGSDSFDQNNAYTPFFMTLGVALIAASHWLRDEDAPQRYLLRIPAYLSHTLMRACTYWRYLGQMAVHAMPSPLTRQASAPSPALLPPQSK